ncbi:ribonuclease D [Tenebrionibacter intestinalis]|uniref:Ribonuclease D n=1 Tax=Tenebrionibacter intestinalis TaxID=2799638 RepID=A0A8K0V4A5_9ENTR|nr:ribonuclease D [Tenebrionibacter intestinalis]MBK4713845.1 ribonuclease D [Tenebrionibacter intestinalis]
MNYQLIKDCVQLAQACEQARRAPAVALDTEFVRTRTYYPQTGLIQLYDGETVSLIDPLAIDDMSAFRDLLLDISVTKFLHAGSEDMEVFLNAFGVMPGPFIDTQVLAAFLNHPLSTGFATMVETYSGVVLDKSEARTDWLARPLTPKQLNYAAADVWYLLPIARRLMDDIAGTGWLEAAQDECRLMQQRRAELPDPQEAYRDIGNAWQLRTRQLACLKLMAAWRLNKARERDLAVNFVVREEHLWQVARYLPGSLGELDSLGLSGSEIRYHGKTLLGFVEQAKALPQAQLPEPAVNLIDMPGYRNAFKLIKALVQDVAKDNGLSPELIASRRQINQLLNWHWKLRPFALPPELASGWRDTLFAGRLHALLAEV